MNKTTNDIVKTLQLKAQNQESNSKLSFRRMLDSYGRFKAGFNLMIKINILEQSKLLLKVNCQRMNFQQYFYPSYFSLQVPCQNNYQSAYYINYCHNPDNFTYFCDIFHQIPSSNATQLTSKEQSKEPSQGLENERQQQNQKKQRKPQYVGRNDFSNMFKSFLYLVFKCETTKTHIKSIIKTMNLSITLNAFSNKLKRKFPDSKTYIGPKEIRKFLVKLEKNEFAGENSIGKLLKILLREFLQHDYKLYVIKKYKGKNQSKKQIFNKCRILYKQLFGQDQ